MQSLNELNRWRKGANLTAYIFPHRELEITNDIYNWLENSLSRPQKEKDQYFSDYLFREWLIQDYFNELTKFYWLSEKLLIHNRQIYLNNELIVELPSRFEDLYECIEKSKYILELKENWDDEGSPPYKKSTWIRAIKFVSDYALWIFTETNKVIDTPKICHGPNGSIDILWKKGNYRLLINIPENTEKPASFYGDDYNSQKVKGEFNISNYNQGLLLTLLQIK